ncbi:MAG TPA: ABC transporter ATP-binding protein [Kouleothrix sp.]|uniref:ABC transporter ATP-binding protein n=1 Tax=Kouleothrix sp. TaxID=2779161 RepID=UPI002C2926F1|nr:ABC transporter ATP-binding protein [Kouleothrix sp.]HRC76149.1 ABC transporter ATP-binding protein [Kouleothrix sp.]
MEIPQAPRQASAGRARQSDLTALTIKADQVEKVFGGDTGVFDLNFEVPAGAIFGMIGPSGCGKTTTVRLLTGLYRRDKGKLWVLGRDPDRFSLRTRERIGYMPQHFVLYPNLTVWENLNFVASLYGMGYLSRRKWLAQALDFVELSDARHRLGSQLSGGMQRRLELACTLVHNPLLIFADEPTAGIDPVLRGKFWDHFRNLRDGGRTLFITTQYVGEAAYCDMVGVMRAGRLLHVDTPENLRRKAFSGEQIQLVVPPAQVYAAAKILMSQPYVADVRRSNDQPGLLVLHVADASDALPLIFNTMSDHPEISVQQADRYVPPFDDVFIRLMEQAEEGHV